MHAIKDQWITVGVEGGHEEEHGHGPDEERKDRPPRLAGTASHVGGRSSYERPCVCLLCCWDSLVSLSLAFTCFYRQAACSRASSVSYVRWNYRSKRAYIFFLVSLFPRLNRCQPDVVTDGPNKSRWRQIKTFLARSPQVYGRRNGSKWISHWFDRPELRRHVDYIVRACLDWSYFAINRYIL